MEHINSDYLMWFTEKELNSIFYELELKVQNAEKTKKLFSYKVAVRDKALIYLMYYCALRVGEITDLKVEDYDFDTHTIYCRRNKNCNSNRLKIVDSKVLQSLEKHFEINILNDLNNQEYLFTNINTYKKMTKGSVDSIIRGKENKVGIGELIGLPEEKCNSLTFRNTRAKNLVDKGLTIQELQYWLGHTRIENTLKYFLIEKDKYVDIKNIYAKLEI